MVFHPRYIGGVMLLVGLLSSGCSAIQSTLSFIPGVHNPNKTAIRGIVLAADTDANNTSGTNIDFLFVFDAGIVSSLPATSPEWFANRSLLINNHGKNMVVSSIGIAPGTTETLVLPSGYKDARDVIAYADYIPVAGQKWVRVPDVKQVKAVLKKSNLTFQEATSK